MSRRQVRLGLTGSIGMGKSTTAGFFREAGVPVWDADAAVDRLYGPGGAGGRALAEIAPTAAGEAGVDRDELRRLIAADPGLLDAVEARIHPLVAAERAAFLEANADAPLVVLDIPLLFETGGDRLVDRVLVVTAPADVQRARVMSRPGMTAETFARLLARQTTDAEKRARADHLIRTDRGFEAARADALALIADLTGDAHA